MRGEGVRLASLLSPLIYWPCWLSDCDFNCTLHNCDFGVTLAESGCDCNCMAVNVSNWLCLYLWLWLEKNCDCGVTGYIYRWLYSIFTWVWLTVVDCGCNCNSDYNYHYYYHYINCYWMLYTYANSGNNCKMSSSATAPSEPSVTLQDVLAAHSRIKDFIHKTPVIRSTTLNEMSGRLLYFKCENLQKAGAFKVSNSRTFSHPNSSHLIIIPTEFVQLVLLTFYVCMESQLFNI